MNIYIPTYNIQRLSTILFKCYPNLIFDSCYPTFFSSPILSYFKKNFYSKRRMQRMYIRNERCLSRNCRSHILIFKGNVETTRSWGTTSFWKTRRYYKRGIIIKLNANRVRWNKEGGRVEVAAALLTFSKSCASETAETSCHIFKRLRIESNWKRGIWKKGKNYGGNAIVIVIDYRWKWLCSAFIRIELFVFTLRSSRGIEMRVEGEIHVTRDREAHRAYVYEGIDKISTLEISIFPFP